jgi:tetratricopeptide (TPR) repeat protein
MVIGAGVDNLDDLTPLRHFLSSKEMLIVLDNAESILDPEGADAQGIYAAVEELSRFSNICLCITSRITIIPSDSETLDIPTLSMEAAHDTFYRIYKNGERSGLVSNILEQLDFHPLSITLLATVAQHSKWDTSRLVKEWEGRRTAVLHAKYSTSLAAAIELSVSSPMFKELGTDARDLLGVVAFFPQGIDENNLDWLFPTISDRTSIFDAFCILSLAYRSNGFVTMLAPLRDHLSSKDPGSSPLLCTTKTYYFHRLAVTVYPDKPGFNDARWITSEDMNVEHLLNVFTSIDENSGEAWTACDHFMEHLFWHKPRLVVLGPKTKGLPDTHPSKAKCLSRLAWSFYCTGNFTESKRLHTDALKLWRECGGDLQVANALWAMSRTNQMAGLETEAIRQAEEVLEIYERLDDIPGQARTLRLLACSLLSDGQLAAAEKVASQVITRFSGKGEEYRVGACHRVLGGVWDAKGETDKAIDHVKAALEITSSFDCGELMFWIHYNLAELFTDKGSFDDALVHIERAKPHAVNSVYCQGRVAELQTWFWSIQQRFEESRSAALHAADIFERLGATHDVERCKGHLQGTVQLLKRRV